MKWKVMKIQGANEVCYLEDDRFNRVVEIVLEKNKYRVRCFKNEDSSCVIKTFSRFTAAKKCGEEWFKKLALEEMESLKKYLEKI